MAPRVLVATSVGPGKEYAYPLLRQVLPSLEGAGGTLLTFDGVASPDIDFGPIYTDRVYDDGSATCRHGRLARMRESQRRFFLASDFDYLYWHDADMAPPCDIIPRLLARQVPIAAGLYNVRGENGPLLTIAGHDPRETGAQYGEYDEIDVVDGAAQVWATGMGCMLVDRATLARVPFRCPSYYTAEGFGEDVLWCLDSGVRPVVDMTLPCWHFDADGTGNRPRVEGMG